MEIEVREDNIVVTGDISHNEDEFTELGGTFNHYLGGNRCGWVFPKHLLSKVQNFIDTGEVQTLEERVECLESKVKQLERHINTLKEMLFAK